MARVVAGATPVGGGAALASAAFAPECGAEVVDLSGLGLDRIDLPRVGAMTTITQLATDPGLDRGWPAVAEAARSTAHAGVRRLATLGGTIAMRSKTSDLLTALAAHGATAMVAGRDGVEARPIAELSKHGLHGELVTEVDLGPPRRGGYARWSTRPGPSPPVLCVAVVEGAIWVNAEPYERIAAHLDDWERAVVDDLAALAVGRGGPQSRPEAALSSVATAATTVVNDRPVVVDATDAGEPLAEWLRRHGHFDVRIGCAEGACGACAVLVDDTVVPSCLMPSARATGHRVDTARHLVAHDPAAKLVAATLIAASAPQCGYCISGIVCAASAALRHGPIATRGDAARAIEGQLCRCTGYQPLLDALVAASATMHRSEHV